MTVERLGQLSSQDERGSGDTVQVAENLEGRYQLPRSVCEELLVVFPGLRRVPYALVFALP